MIVNFKYLNKKKIKLVMVDGGFDPLHDGHIRYFQEARKRYKKYKIVCCLANDRYIKRKHKVLLNQERNYLIRKFNYQCHHDVDDILLSETDN